MPEVSPIPSGYNSVSAYLIVKDGQVAIDFYKKAFGAAASSCLNGPDGKSIIHAEVKIGNSTVMLSDENPQWNTQSPETLGGSPVSMMIYLPDVDTAFQKAVDAGCKVIAPVTDQFWGDRMGKVEDPFGYQWAIATHVEEIPDDEMQKRAAEFFASFEKSET